MFTPSPHEGIQVDERIRELDPRMPAGRGGGRGNPAFNVAQGPGVFDRMGGRGGRGGFGRGFEGRDGPGGRGGFGRGVSGRGVSGRGGFGGVYEPPRFGDRSGAVRDRVRGREWPAHEPAPVRNPVMSS
eukprot:2789998-Pyramimonas_sp.AAC.1